LNWYRYRIATAPPEGLDKRIRALIRMACVFMNIGNLRRMTMAVREFIQPAKAFRSRAASQACFRDPEQSGSFRRVGTLAGTSALDWSHAGKYRRHFQGKCALFQEHEAPLR
jgi:hypothetical protein